MRSVNKVILVGNLTRDPEMRQTESGQTIVTFGIATNREWSTPEGKKSLAEYHNVVAWGRLAELCVQLLKKGNLVYIEGYLKTRSWDHPESGVKIHRTEIVMNDMIRLGGKRNDENGAEFAEDAAHHGNAAGETAQPETGTPEDDDFFADLDGDSAGTEK